MRFEVLEFLYDRPVNPHLNGKGMRVGNRVPVVSQGPVGQNVSHDFPRTHCLSAKCHLRAETSLAALRFLGQFEDILQTDGLFGLRLDRRAEKWYMPLVGLMLEGSFSRQCG
jgi:hypothetical protein